MATLTRAERQERTRSELVDAAERLFSARGFHATSLDAVADAAGYTKGAVYSNFAGKEELFFAVYERRAERRAAELRELGAGRNAGDGIRAAMAAVGRRRDDGWMAVFFEFWAHVLRHPEHRERFARAHRRALEPFADAVERLAAEQGIELPLTAEALATAQLAMGNGLQLERLTRPNEVDADLIERIMGVLLEDLERRGRDR